MRVSIARALWIVWAFLLWNVVFDHVIVVAGRQYIAAAYRATASNHFENMDDWMRPAVTRALLTATSGSAVVLGVGLTLVRKAR